MKRCVAEIISSCKYSSLLRIPIFLSKEVLLYLNKIGKAQYEDTENSLEISSPKVS